MYFLICFILLMVTGCASSIRTFAKTAEGENKVYIGTKEWIDTYSDPNPPESTKWQAYFLGLVDMPLSLVMDTLYLPYTVPASFVKPDKTVDGSSPEENKPK
ncbi:YceK/YidQ family lipoprotein [Oryzomonas japonica]|nr:YceK/YidQ family lipoprotein [Oryzomonas japonica]